MAKKTRRSNPVIAIEKSSMLDDVREKEREAEARLGERFLIFAHAPWKNEDTTSVGFILYGCDAESEFFPLKHPEVHHNFLLFALGTSVREKMAIQQRIRNLFSSFEHAFGTKDTVKANHVIMEISRFLGKQLQSPRISLATAAELIVADMYSDTVYRLYFRGTYNKDSLVAEDVEEKECKECLQPKTPKDSKKRVVYMVAYYGKQEKKILSAVQRIILDKPQPTIKDANKLAELLKTITKVRKVNVLALVRTIGQETQK